MCHWADHLKGDCGVGSDAQFNQLKELVWEYSDVFALSDSELGFIQVHGQVQWC